MLKEKIQLPSEYFTRGFHYGSIGIPLNARISMMGYECPQRGSYYWDGLKRGSEEFVLWQCGLDGAGELRFENTEYQLNPGQAMLLTIPHNHYYQVSRQSREWKILFIILRGSECLRICKSLIEMFGPVAPAYSAGLVIESVQKILNHVDENNAWKMSELAYSFLMSLSSENQPDDSPHLLSTQLKSARRFALKNFDSGIGVSDMAEVSGMSYSHFSREFMARCQISPGAFLTQLKMEKALNLLQTNSLSIKEIANECGFSSTSYFCRAFQKRFQTSPDAFRKKHMPLPES